MLVTFTATAKATHDDQPADSHTDADQIRKDNPVVLPGRKWKWQSPSKRARTTDDDLAPVLNQQSSSSSSSRGSVAGPLQVDAAGGLEAHPIVIDPEPRESSEPPGVEHAAAPPIVNEPRIPDVPEVPAVPEVPEVPAVPAVPEGREIVPAAVPVPAPKAPWACRHSHLLLSHL